MLAYLEAQISEFFVHEIVIIFLSSHLNVMFWVLKRIVSMSPFFWVPTACFGVRNNKLIL